MRIILIIQSLIILAGAYYVYTLTRTSEDFVSEFESVSNIETKIRSENNSSAIEEDNNDTVLSNDGSNMIEGANDLGMEFPMPVDDEVPESR